LTGSHRCAPVEGAKSLQQRGACGITPHDVIIALFYTVDQEMLEVPKHPDAKLYQSEVVTLALL
jgi:hypothetical protein